MKQTMVSRFPKMRERALIVDELPNEVLVYDQERHKAHCLNQTAALVWKHCDGKTPPERIARRLQRVLDQPFNEDLVWLALHRLDKIHLLEKPIVLPNQLAGMSRRQMVRAMGVAAVVAVPVVTSIVAPTAGEAATCWGKNQGPCTGPGSMPCCPGFTCNAGANQCK